MTAISKGVEKVGTRRPADMLAAAVSLLCLAAPSLWLMMTVPPLWRDADAYVQTVYPPGAPTILLHRPLYCVLARVPLWIGYLVSGIGGSISLGNFIVHPRLTDAGVSALVLLQHTGLWFAALLLINAISASVAVRLLLAVFFASQPLFYSFAHCVGSEALSMIGTLLLAGTGLRIVLRYPNVKIRDWVIFGAFLCCCILTRHLNSVLAAVLPLTVFLLAILRRLRAPKSENEICDKHFDLARDARIWVTSIGVGIAALVFATGFTHFLCWRAHIQWRSKFGFTFVWRLNFLESIPIASRNALLDTTASKCKLPDTRRLLGMVESWFDQNKYWDPQRFIKTARGAFFIPGTNFQDKKFDRLLNDMALAFLRPPSRPLFSAALGDFATSTRLTEGDVARYLFLTTDYFFSHRDTMPQCALLKTFREPHSELTSARNRFYFRCWDALSFRAWSIIGLLVFCLSTIMSKNGTTERSGVILYAGCLYAVGVVMVAINCFFAQTQPRFALPMMEFLFISIVILLGVILDQCVGISWARRQRA